MSLRVKFYYLNFGIQQRQVARDFKQGPSYGVAMLWIIITIKTSPGIRVGLFSSLLRKTGALFEEDNLVSASLNSCLLPVTIKYCLPAGQRLTKSAIMGETLCLIGTTPVHSARS